LGLLLKDSNLIQYTEEDGHSEETPQYIVGSGWGIYELNRFNSFLKRVKADLTRPSPAAR
jgi:hypothetical protein